MQGESCFQHTTIMHLVLYKLQRAILHCKQTSCFAVTRKELDCKSGSSEGCMLELAGGSSLTGLALLQLPPAAFERFRITSSLKNSNGRMWTLGKNANDK